METKYKSLFIAILTLGMVFTGCSDSDSDSEPPYDPFSKQVQRIIYPASLLFRNTTNNETVTKENWEFTYNHDNTIASYKFEQTIKGENIDITENINGSLAYREEWDGSKSIITDVTSNYVSTTKSGTLTREEEYRETAQIENDVIISIERKGDCTENGIPKTISSNRVFTYSNKFCTGSTFEDSDEKIKYTYTWENNKLTKATIHTTSKSNSNISHGEYTYSYDDGLATNYGFNTLAFVQSHNPQIYGAMNLFGKTTPYLLEKQNYSEYEKFDGIRHETQKITREYTISDNNSLNSIIYSVISPTYKEYVYEFKPNYSSWQ